MESGTNRDTSQAGGGTGNNLPRLLSVLDQLTEEELHQLNHVIVQRLRLMQEIRAHNKMMNFRPGQRVSFTGPTGELVSGVLTKMNRKSVTIAADDGRQWRVSPSFLKPAVS